MRRLVAALGIMGVVLGVPTAAFAQTSPLAPALTPPVFTTTTSTVYCADVTPLDTISPVALTETQTLTEIPFRSSTFVLGLVTLTGPGGGTLRLIDAYLATPVGNPAEVTDVEGWVVVGPGAIGGDVTYIEGGSAFVDHYGVPGDIQGPSIDACVALDA